MKKLMIAAAIICAAVIAQAGTVEWKSSYLCQYGVSGEEGPFYNGTIYLMDGSQISKTTFITALADAGDDWMTVFNAKVDTAANVFNSATQGDAKLSSPSKGYMDGKIVVQDVGSLASASLYMVALDSVNKAVYMSENIEQSIIPMGGTPFTYTNAGAMEGNTFKFADGAQTAGGWYTAAAVPEPTSGLLLLLGVAGLALKRKRA